VVWPVAGTTRDAISAQVMLKRGFVHMTDVAGLEDTAPADEIERQMHERAVETLERADVVLLVIDATDDRPPLELSRRPDLIVRNKSDLMAPSPGTPGEGRGEGSPSSASQSANPQNPHPNPLPEYRERGQDIVVSALTGANLSLVHDRLDALAFGRTSGFGVALNARHLRAIDDARAALSRAAQHIGVADELIAFELRQSLDALGQILGVVSPDELLGRIFSTFCIGK
jgi:tRNA modification GTPase